jgi:hypothetical protein
MKVKNLVLQLEKVTHSTTVVNKKLVQDVKTNKKANNLAEVLKKIHRNIEALKKKVLELNKKMYKLIAQDPNILKLGEKIKKQKDLETLRIKKQVTQCQEEIPGLNEQIKHLTQQKNKLMTFSKARALQKMVTKPTSKRLDTIKKTVQQRNSIKKKLLKCAGMVKVGEKTIRLRVENRINHMSQRSFCVGRKTKILKVLGSTWGRAK